MKISISFSNSAAGGPRELADQVTYVQEAEKLGVEAVWTMEGWGQDAATPLAYLAAMTTRIRLGTAIMQITARTPAMTAMTALTLAALSQNRFILGLGVSGPQVVEGLHGRPFKAPLTRMRETVDIVRLAFAGEKLEYHGKHHELPLAAGEGKALRLAQPGNPSIPIYLATLGPNSLEYTGASADGWIGTAFTPEHADAQLDHIRRGAQSAGRQFTDLDIHVGAADVAFGNDLDALAEPLRMGRAFTLGAMGSAKTNYYNQAYSRGGWGEASAEVQRMWIAGQRAEAAARVPAEMILQGNLLGDENMVSERLRAYRQAGVTTLKVKPAGTNLDERLDTLGRLMDLARTGD